MVVNDVKKKIIQLVKEINRYRPKEYESLNLEYEYSGPDNENWESISVWFVCDGKNHEPNNFKELRSKVEPLCKEICKSNNTNFIELSCDGKNVTANLQKKVFDYSIENHKHKPRDLTTVIETSLVIFNSISKLVKSIPLKNPVKVNDEIFQAYLTHLNSFTYKNREFYGFVNGSHLDINKWRDENKEIAEQGYMIVEQQDEYCILYRNNQVFMLDYQTNRIDLICTGFAQWLLNELTGI